MNATNEHTPGPWNITADQYGPVVTGWAIDAAPIRVVATVRNTGEASEADARLIAAAPQLLAYLEIWTDERLVNVGRLPGAFVSGARALIAAATLPATPQS